MTKKAIITGATGFVGSNLCEELVRQGWNVTVIVRQTSDLSKLECLKNSIDIYEHKGTISDLIKFFKLKNADVVFHLASLFIAEHSNSDLKPLVQSNLLFGLEVLEAMKESKTKILVNTGTSWQHYHTFEYNPVNLYAATKEAFDKLIRYYVAAEEFRVITLKLFDTYGEMDTRPKLINLLNQFADEQKELKMSHGEQIIDLVHVSDVVNAFIKAVDYLMENNQVLYEEFGVGTGNPILLKELIMLFEEVTEKKINVIWGGREYRKREVMKLWQGYKVLPNWQCQVTLREGLLRYKK